MIYNKNKKNHRTRQDQSAKGAKNTSLFTYNYTHATCQI
jgi:hypothetical protein